MATISATFVLHDEATPALEKIAAEAKITDAAIDSLGRRMQTFEGQHSQSSKNVSRDADAMARDVRGSLGDMDKDLTRVTRGLKDFTGESGRLLRGPSGTSNKRGGLLGFLGGIVGQGSRARKAIMGIGDALDKVQNKLKFRINLGPLRTTVGSAVDLLVGVIPAAVAGLGSFLGAAATAFVALGVAAGGAAVALSAFVVGLASVAIPAAIALRTYVKHKQALDAAVKSMSMARRGTREWANDLRKVQAIEKSMSPGERQLNSNWHTFVQTWNKFVMNGPAGQEAFTIINQGLQFASKLLPTVATEMDRFTTATDSMFRKMLNNEPALQGNIQKLMKHWPAVYQNIGTGGGNMFMGLINVMRALNPLADKLSLAFLHASQAFATWTGKPENMRRMTQFFMSMWPIIVKIADVIGDIAKMFVDIAKDPRNQKATLSWLDQIGKLAKNLPGFIGKMSHDWEKMWPTIDRGLGGLKSFLETMSPVSTFLISSFGTLLGWLDKIPHSGEIARKAVAGIFMVSVATRFLTTLTKITNTLGLIPKLGRAAGIGRKAGTAAEDVEKLGGKGGGSLGRILGERNAVMGAMMEAASQNVYVTNYKGNPASWVPVIVMADESKRRGTGDRVLSELGGGGGALGAAAGLLTVAAGSLTVAGASLMDAVGGKTPIKPIATPHTSTGPQGARKGLHGKALTHGGAALPPVHVPKGTPRGVPLKVAPPFHANPIHGPGTGTYTHGHVPSGNPSWKFYAGTAAATAIGGAGLFGLAGLLGGGAAAGGFSAADAAWLAKIGIGTGTAATAGAMATSANAAPQKNSLAQTVQSSRGLAAAARTTSASVIGSALSAMRGVTAVAQSSTSILGSVFTSFISSIWSAFSTAGSGIGQMFSGIAASAGNALGGILGGASGGGATPGAGGGSAPAAKPGKGGTLSQGSGALSQVGPVGKVGQEKGVSWKGVNPAFTPVTSLAAKLGLSVSATTNGHHGKDSLHYKGDAIDYAIPGLQKPDPKKTAFYNDLVPYAKSGALAELIYEHHGWYHGKAYDYTANDHMNHVHVGITNRSLGSGDPGNSMSSRMKKQSIGHTISLNFGEVHIHNDDSYDEFAKKLVDKLEHHLGTVSSVDASEMVGI